MIIGVLSDTHGDWNAIRRIVNAWPKVDLILHAGDLFRDSRQLAEEGFKVVAVKGNCDYLTLGPVSRVISVGEKRIWITHGHRFGVKNGTRDLVEMARRMMVDMVVFGHTHRPLLKREGDLLLMNPGSAASPRGGSRPGWGIIEVEGDLRPSLHQLG